MAISVSLNGAPYNIPEVGDANWAAALTLYLQALATAFPQTATGSSGFACFVEANTGSATQSITQSVATTVIYGTEVTDTDNAYNPATGQFVVPVGKTGRYLVEANARFSALTANTGLIQLAVFKNGVIVQAGPTSDASNGATQGYGAVVVVNAVAGDLIDVRMFQGQVAARSLINSATDNRLTITRML